MMWIQKQHFFEIGLLVYMYSCIYRSSIDMILKVTSNFKMPLNIYLCLSRRNFFIHCSCFSVDKFNSKYNFKHNLLIIFCNDDRDQML